MDVVVDEEDVYLPCERHENTLALIESLYIHQIWFLGKNDPFLVIFEMFLPKCDPVTGAVTVYFTPIVSGRCSTMTIILFHL